MLLLLPVWIDNERSRPFGFSGALSFGTEEEKIVSVLDIRASLPGWPLVTPIWHSANSCTSTSPI